MHRRTAFRLRGRVTGLLICVGTPTASLSDIANQGATALELANEYTDSIEAPRPAEPPLLPRRRNSTSRRRESPPSPKPNSPAYCFPAYEVGGDWFDFVENRDGAWLAIADSPGTGPTAAGLGAAALGALRSARRSGEDLEGALKAIDETVRRLDHPDFYVTGLVARWRAATAALTWVNCGHPNAHLVDVEGTLHELIAPEHAPLGIGAPRTAFS